MGIKDTDRTSPDSAQLRKHYYLEQYVAVAPRRLRRPQRSSSTTPGGHTPRNKHPVTSKSGILEIPGEEDAWRVKVIPNAYPAFTPDNYQSRGRQELVLETAREDTPFYALEVEEMEDILRAYQRRIFDLSQDYQYVSVFKNHGADAGASLDYTHSQIIATDLAPPQIAYQRHTLHNYQLEHQSSPMCDVIRWELTNKERVIAHTRYTTTICPYSSRFPLEAWIIPNRQVRSLVELDDNEIHSLADHLKGIATALSVNKIDFNYHIAEPINGYSNHCYLTVIPRLTVPGGFEHDTGIYINPVSPEYAAPWYQKHVKTPDVG